MEASLNGRRGGKLSKRLHTPSEGEQLAIATAAAMLWAELKSSMWPDFFSIIAEEVKRAGSTTISWTKSDIVWVFHDKAMNTIGQAATQRYLQRKFKGVDDRKRRRELAADFVSGRKSSTPLSALPVVLAAAGGSSSSAGGIGAGSSGAGQEQPALPKGYEYQPPTQGDALVGWSIKSTFPTGPTKELRWHDGYIYEHHGAFYPIDSGDEWFTLPLKDNDMCFRKAHLANAKVTQEEVRMARRAVADADEP